MRELVRVGGKDLVMATDKYGHSCLHHHHACSEGHLAVVKLLLSADDRALPRIASNDGGTCLHAACLEGHAQVVRQLMQVSGKDLPLVRDKQGRRCLHVGVRRGRRRDSRIRG